jgi:hypothetical protein
MFLCSTTRLLLRFLVRSLFQGHILARDNVQVASTNVQRLDWGRINGTYMNSPMLKLMLPPKALESYLLEVDNLVKEAYVGAKVTKEVRGSIERTMFLKAEVPEVLMPAVKQMLTTKLEKLSEHSDPAKVYMHDIAWLALTDDQRSVRMSEKHIIDVVKKMPLSHTANLRKCARCGSVTEDISPTTSIPGWLGSMIKTCVCNNPWIGTMQSTID